MERGDRGKRVVKLDNEWTKRNLAGSIILHITFLHFGGGIIRFVRTRLKHYYGWNAIPCIVRSAARY